MSNFRPINRDMDFLMPSSVDEWLAQRHLQRARACANAGAGLQRLVDLAAVNILLMRSRRCSMPTG